MAKKDQTPEPESTNGTAVAVQEPARQGDLIVTEYKALQAKPERMAMLIKDNIGVAGLNVFKLDRIKVPSGSGPAMWSLPGFKLEAAEAFEAIVIAKADKRAYWSTPYGAGAGNTPPECSSDDCVTGIGTPGGICRMCPYAQYGSAKKPNGAPARGQACSQGIMLLLLRPKDTLPTLLLIPPGSLSDVGKYFMRLTQSDMSYREVITKFSLKNDKNSDNVDYFKVQMEPVRPLNTEELSRAALLTEAMAAFFGQQHIERDDVAGA